MRNKFEARIQLITAETENQKARLQEAYRVYEQTLQGHSFQSLTGRVPAAAERLLPTLEDLARESQPEEPNDYDEIRSMGTEGTSVY